MVFETLILATSICLPIGKELGYSEKFCQQAKIVSYLAKETIDYGKAESLSMNELDLVIEKGFMDYDFRNINREPETREGIRKQFIESGKEEKYYHLEKELFDKGILNDITKKSFDYEKTHLFDFAYDFESILREKTKTISYDDLEKSGLDYEEVDDGTIKAEEKKEASKDWFAEPFDDLEFDEDKAVIISGGLLDGKPLNGYILSADFCKSVFNIVNEFLQTVCKTTLSAFGFYGILTAFFKNAAAAVATLATKLASLIGSLLSYIFAIPVVGKIICVLLIAVSVGAACILAMIMIAACLDYGYAIGYQGSIWNWDLRFVSNLVKNRDGDYYRA
ncbi:MAG: hypothetical protein MJ228_02045 [Bacilli bacterium]|nr:hypothetical protein [Bacilli bacterium]